MDNLDYESEREYCEKIWNDRHHERAVAFLRGLRQLEEKHQCLVVIDEAQEVNPGYYVEYRDPYTGSEYVQICPTIVDEIYKGACS